MKGTDYSKENRVGVSVEICGEAADVAGDRILHQPYVFGTIQAMTFHAL